MFTDLTASPASALDNTSTSTLISGSQWTGRDASGKTVITYSFANAASQFSAESANFCATISEFSAADRALTRAVLDSISAVCNVAFVEVADTGASCGLVRYAYSQAPNNMGYAGFAYFPSAHAIGGDVWIGGAQAGAQWDFYRPNLVLHETLHAIGLKHPFEGGATLDGRSDIIANTVMSYSPIAGSTNGYLSKYPAEPMALDVAALQALYGAASHNAGDTAYDLSQASFQAFRTLWDSSGVDLLDASRMGKGVTLDLQDGALSDIGASVRAAAYFGDTVRNMDYTFTLSIARGAHIENATGSAFDDVLLGNAFDNVLAGGRGADVLRGGGGSNQLFGGDGADRFIVGAGYDRVDGGEGEDVATFAGQRDAYVITEAPGTITVSRAADHATVATLMNVERLEFSDGVMALLQADRPLTQVAGYGGQALRLYKAALDRLPDSEGLTFHTQSLQSGMSLIDVASHFMDSPEFNANYGRLDDENFVELLYQNVLDREAESEGLAFHLDRLDSGASREEILIGFSESPENQAALIGLGQVPVLYML